MDLHAPWPWYVAGPLIGLTVPLLYVLGNRSLGISSNLRHLCAALLPARSPFFQYDWKSESWNLVFATGLVFGGFIATAWLADPSPLSLDPEVEQRLVAYGLQPAGGLLPAEVFSLGSLLTIRGFVFMVLGGFLVGFGTRYAGGCTSGHSITGLSTLQWPSLVATICFMIGGIAATWLLVPYLLAL
jgi:uncharacterized membrane protein YedE/YeeE